MNIYANEHAQLYRVVGCMNNSMCAMAYAQLQQKAYFSALIFQKNIFGCVLEHDNKSKFEEILYLRKSGILFQLRGLFWCILEA